MVRAAWRTVRPSEGKELDRISENLSPETQ